MVILPWPKRIIALQVCANAAGVYAFIVGAMEMRPVIAFLGAYALSLGWAMLKEWRRLVRQDRELQAFHENEISTSAPSVSPPDFSKLRRKAAYLLNVSEEYSKLVHSGTEEETQIAVSVLAAAHQLATDEDVYLLRQFVGQ